MNLKSAVPAWISEEISSCDCFTLKRVRYISIKCEHEYQPCRNDTGKKVNHFQAVISMSIKKVESITKFLNIRGLFVCIVLQNDLFEPKKGSFVGDFLTNLTNSLPGKFRINTSTSIAILICDNVLYDKHLLKNCGCKDFFLDCQLDFNSSAVRLSPDC